MRGRRVPEPNERTEDGLEPEPEPEERWRTLAPETDPRNVSPGRPTDGATELAALDLEALGPISATESVNDVRIRGESGASTHLPQTALAMPPTSDCAPDLDPPARVSPPSREVSIGIGARCTNAPQTVAGALAVPPDREQVPWVLPHSFLALAAEVRSHCGQGGERAPVRWPSS